MYNYKLMVHTYIIDTSFLLFQVAQAIENLIKEHQRRPGSILHALIERLGGNSPSPIKTA